MAASHTLDSFEALRAKILFTEGAHKVTVRSVPS